jgi:hypothetical protein
MNKYTFEFEYSVPEFATVEVETKEDDMVKVTAIAKEEFYALYPEAIDPVVVQVTNAN